MKTLYFLRNRSEKIASDELDLKEMDNFNREISLSAQVNVYYISVKTLNFGHPHPANSAAIYFLVRDCPCIISMPIYWPILYIIW